MIRFSLKDDKGRTAIVKNTDEAIMWMLGKTGVSVKVCYRRSNDFRRSKHDEAMPASPFDGLPEIPTVGKVS